MKMPEEFLAKISALAEKTDEILPRVLAAGGAIVEGKVKSNLEAVIATGADSRTTGQLVSALGTSTAMQDRDGNFNVKVGFAENRNDGKSNAMIAGVLEYGKQGQPPRPFLKPAKTASRTACQQVMIATLEEELNRL